MLKLVCEHHPEASLMIAGNAYSNAAMLAINHKLGFRAHKSVARYQIGAEAIRRYLAEKTPLAFTP